MGRRLSGCGTDVSAARPTSLDCRRREWPVPSARGEWAAWRRRRAACRLAGSSWERVPLRQAVGEKGSGVDSLDLGNDSPTPPPPPHEQWTSSPTCPFRGAIHPPDQGSGRRAEDGLGRSVAESLWSGCRGCPAGSAGPAFLFTWSYLESLWRCP